MITGQTNVLSMRTGAGCLASAATGLGRFAVTTMDVPWALARDRITARPLAVVHVESMEWDVVERQLATLPDLDTVVAIGGGQACDLGKYFAWRRGCRLVTVPTVVSVDAFVTPAAAIRRNHRVEYLGTASPDPLVIDYSLIRSAPAQLNIAGVGDILSIHTATCDWEIAHRAEKDVHGYNEPDVKSARAIVEMVEANADQIRNVTDVGIQTIVDACLRINCVCLPKGHFRSEEGSEHFLFYELEERLKRPFIHGQIVGLGICLLSRLQENRPQWIAALMDRCGRAYQPADLGISREALKASLLNLRRYALTTNLWHSVIQEREITPSWVDLNLADLRFPEEPPSARTQSGPGETA